MYNEVYKNSKVRKFYNQIYDWAKSLPENVIVKKKTEAENLFKKIGITFSVSIVRSQSKYRPTTY